MLDALRNVVSNADSIDRLHLQLCFLLKKTKAEKQLIRIGFVSGIITSDGPQHTESNMKKVIAYTHVLREINPYPIFSTMDVFPFEIREKLSLHTVTHEKFLNFWRQVLETRCITDLFLTPRWEHSTGAIDEYNTAKKIGMTIHYISDKSFGKK